MDISDMKSRRTRDRSLNVDIVLRGGAKEIKSTWRFGTGKSRNRKGKKLSEDGKSFVGNFRKL